MLRTDRELAPYLTRAFLLGYRAGEAARAEGMVEPDLSGEWADSLTPNALMRELGLDPYEVDPDDSAELCSAWEEGVAAAYYREEDS